MSDLSLVPTDDLINEMLRRHDHLVMVGMKVTSAKGEFISFRRWIGNSSINIGLVETAKHLICQEEIQNAVSIRNPDR